MKNLFVLLLIASMFASCAEQKHYSDPIANKSTENSYQDSPYDKSVRSQESQSRMVIYNSTVSMVVISPDSTNLRLTDIATKYDGYIQTLGSEKSVIRVRADKLKLALEELNNLGKVKYKKVSGEDVTDQYTDFQIRLDNAKKARERYLELLAKAENVEAALKVEKELERLNVEIDALEGKINRFQHLTQYSTLTVYMQEKIKPGVLGYIGIGLYHSVKWLFVRN